MGANAALTDVHRLQWKKRDSSHGKILQSPSDTIGRTVLFFVVVVVVVVVVVLDIPGVEGHSGVDLPRFSKSHDPWLA